jgi:FKBP-type peptidyl-prolyl cis-trans isomerase FkpA
MWIIAIVMAAGFIGSYFLIILNNNQAQQDAQNPNASQAAQQDTKKASNTVDPTAYKVTGPVSSLQMTDEVVGTGAEVKEGDSITVHYKGTLAQSGIKFDSSYDRGEPITFSLSGVIVGWQKGIPGMKVGGKRRLLIPSSMGYGAQGSGSTIPPNSDLVFEVELLGIGAAASQ